MANTFDPSGANNMAAIKDRITKTLSDATRDMTPLETFGNIGRAAAQAATGHTTYGDAMNAMNAKRIEAAKQMMGVLQQEKQLELQERADARDADRMELDRDRFGLQQDQFEAGEKRAVGEERRAETRLGLEEENLNLRREELTHKRLQDAAAQGDADAKAVVDALQSLVPEDQRSIYAAAMADLPYAVDKTNVVAAVGRIRRDLEAKGGIPGEMADIKDVAALRDDYTGMSKKFVDSRDAYGKVRASAQDPSPAGDLALIINYMKVLDPTSVVRETEAGNVEVTGNIPDRTVNILKRVYSGERLTEDQRADFVNRAGMLFKRDLDNYDRMTEGVRLMAKRANMNPDDVVLDFAGPLRFEAMSDEELTQAMEGAKSRAEFDAAADEAERRALAGAQ